MELDPARKGARMNPICFYHKADLDGVCSGAIVKHFVPDVELVGYDYGEKFPRDKVRPGPDAEHDPLWAHLFKTENGYEGPEQNGGFSCESIRFEKRTVYMVDVSLPPEDMKWLAQVSNLIWLDHHRSAHADWEKYRWPCGGIGEGVYTPHESACEIAWSYFSFKQTEGLPKMQVGDGYHRWLAAHRTLPEAVRLLGRYDVWDKDHPDWESKILPFQYGCRSLDGIYDPANEWWPLLLRPPAETREELLKFPATQEWESLEGGAQTVAYGRKQAHLFECRIPLDEIHPRLAENWVDGIQVIHAEIVEPKKHLRPESIGPEEEERMKPFLRLTGVDVRHKTGKIIQHGRFIISYQAEVNRRACETGAYELELVMLGYEWVAKDSLNLDFYREQYKLRSGIVDPNCGFGDNILRVLACNTIVFNSQFFGGVYDPEKHDVMCAYAQLADGRWKVGLYSTKPEIDCGAICKMVGGGGHRGAAGFICDKLPWGR